MTDPHNPGEVVVTIKYGKGYEEPWAVFHGPDSDSVKAKIIDYFGMDPGDVALSAHALTNNAKAIAQNLHTISQSFPGAMVVSEEQSAQLTPPPAPAPPAEHPLLARIAAVPTVADLQSLWAENKAEFDTNPALMAAYKAKGKSLS